MSEIGLDIDASASANPYTTSKANAFTGDKTFYVAPAIDKTFLYIGLGIAALWLFRRRAK